APKYAKSITPEFVEDIFLVAPLHDIGKVGIPDEILTKPGALTDEEFEIMKTHTDIGRQCLEFALASTGQAPMLRTCVDIAYCHHEKYDGSGYPRGIAGDDIPLSARIITLVDAYDAITSRRRYAEARSHEQAAKIVQAEAGRHFDPDVAAAFIRCADQFDAVRRAHGQVAEEHVLVPA
ncbi:MAG: HD-GYP domain-containing protein, partial [Planctomycetota bacterium]